MIEAIALLAAAINYADVPMVTGKRTVGEACHVTARDQAGPFKAIVTWARCSEVRVRIVTIAELAETDEFNGLGCEDVAAIVRSNRGHLVSAWGEFAATVYPREPNGSTREVAISD